METIRLAREVGGTDVGTVLRTLSAFLREDARTRAELEARQSWTVNAARVAVAAPWLVLLLLGSQPETARAYDTATGTAVLRGGRGWPACWRTGRWSGSDGCRPSGACCGERGAGVSGAGALLGLAVLAGLASLVAGVPRRPRLRAPARSVPGRPAGGPAPAGWPTGPARWDSVMALVRAGGADRRPDARRRRVGAAPARRCCPDGRTLRDFRAEQLAYGALGLVAGAVVGAALTVATGRSAVAGPLLAGAGGVAGVLARDVALTRRVRRRQAAVLAEFPVVAELLALAVTAGEGPVGALDRVCRLTGGALTADLGAALARVRAGAPLAAALEELRDRAGVPVLARFVDGMLVALERGTPLADVLRAQAADVREAGRRALLETGGRREIAMLAPVVFVILPTTVLFALYPGLVAVAGLAGG